MVNTMVVKLLRALLLAAVAVLMISVFGGCRPDFPECRDDKDCQAAKDQNEGRFLYCINKKCEECRSNADCPGAGWECRNYRCQKPECTSDAECADGLVCRNYKCRPECTSNRECPPGNKCENNRCVPDIECTSDADCPEGKTCQNGKCRVDVGAPKCQLETINFDFDMFNIRSDAREILNRNANCLKQRPELTKVTIEGHCDERGTTEYNLSLGERRANAARKYLMDLGIDGKRLKTVSYGKERPVDPRSNESAWEKNRRAEFVTSN